MPPPPPKQTKKDREPHHGLFTKETQKTSLNIKSRGLVILSTAYNIQWYYKRNDEISASFYKLTVEVKTK